MQRAAASKEAKEAKEATLKWKRSQRLLLLRRKSDRKLLRDRLRNLVRHNGCWTSQQLPNIPRSLLYWPQTRWTMAVKVDDVDMETSSAKSARWDLPYLYVPDLSLTFFAGGN
jgi:hypothetical protein